jgi:hypothetical protein
VIHDRSRVLICPWCAGDLRQAPEGAAPIQQDSFDLWVAREAGAIIAHSAGWYEPSIWRPVAALKQLCASRGLNNAAELGHFVGTSKLTAWYWLTGKARPSLPFVFQIYHRFGRSLAQHLVSRNPKQLPEPLKLPSQEEIYLRQERHPQRISWAHVRKRLQAELNRPVRDARTLLAISKALHIERRVLRMHEPVLCRKLSNHYRQRRRDEIAARAKMLRQRMLSATKNLLAASMPITQQNIEKTMRQPGLFNRRYAREIFAGLSAMQYDPSYVER